MPNLADLLVRVGWDTRDFVSGAKDISTDLKAIDKEARGLERAFAGFDKIGDRMVGFGSALTAGVTLPIAAMAAGSIAASVKIDEAMDHIRSSTGATGAVLESLGGTFRKVFGDVPNSAAAVSAAVSDLNSRLGITGPSLDGLTTQLLNLARVSGSEVGPLIASSTRLFGDWSVSTDKQSAALDFMFRTSQQTGIGVNHLMELVVQFGAPLRALGFDMESAAAMMGKWEKEGVNLETVLSGLRFALGNFAKAGKEPEQALRDIIAQIQNAKTESEATGIAFQTFGKRAAVDMSRAIIEGRFSIDELVGSLKNSKETINRAAEDTLSFADKMKRLKNEVTLAVEPLGNILVGALEKLLDAAKPMLETVRGLAEKFTDLPPALQAATLAIGGTAFATGPLLFAFGAILTMLPNMIAGWGILSGVMTTTLIPAIANVVFAVGTGMTAALTAGEFALLALGTAAVAAVAAFALFKLGEWAYEQFPAVAALFDKIRDLAFAIPLLGDELRELFVGTGVSAQGTKEFADSVVKLEAELKAAGITVDRGTKNINEYWRALVEAGEKSGKFAAATAEVAKTQKNLTPIQLAAAKASEEFRKAVDKEKASLIEADKKAKIHAQALSELGKQSRSTAEAHKYNLQHTIKLIDKDELLAARVAIVAAEHRKLVGEVAAYQRAIETGTVKTIDIGEAFTDTGRSIDAAGQKLNTLKNISIPSYISEISKVIVPHDALQEALKKLGITSTTTYKQLAEEAAKARDAILGSDAASDFEKKSAIYKALKAQAEYARAAGIEITDAQRKLLDDLSNELDKKGTGLSAMQQKWKDFSDDVSGTISGTFDGIAKGLFRGDTSFGEQFKKMAQNLGDVMVDHFLTPVTTAIGDFIAGALTDLLSGKGFGGVLSHAKEIGTTLKDIFGSGAGEAAGGAVQAGTGSIGGAGGAGGSAAGAASSGVAGIVTAIAGVATAISSIVGNFQMAHMNQTLDLIEKSARYSEIYLAELITRGQNIFLAELPNIRGLQAQFLNDHAWRIHDVWDRLGELIDVVRYETNQPQMQMAAAGGGGTHITINISGNATKDKIDYMVAELSRNMR